MKILCISIFIHAIALKFLQIFKHAYINVFTLKTEKVTRQDCSGFLQIESHMHEVITVKKEKINSRIGQ